MSGASGRVQWLAMAVLGLALALVWPTAALGWLTLLLGGLTALKLREARTVQERRLASLLQLLSVGMISTQRPELGPSLLLALASLLALAGLLGLEAGAGASPRELLNRSVQLLLASLPVALALFLLLPRLNPIVSLPGSQGQGAVTGLDTTLEPGAIASLVASDAPAARVTFPGGGPPPPEERYWRVLVHDRFDGRRWTITAEPEPVPRGRDERGGGGRILELWLEEPSGLDSVPWSGAGQPRGREVGVSRRGELRHSASSGRRRVYALGEGPAAGWRVDAPSRQDLALPQGANPRLLALAADWARSGPAAERLAAAERWFRQQPFEYTMSPGTLPGRDPLDAFLFERRRGFCEHYASALTALMRAAGVPARVVSGYHGGTWVEPLGGQGYLDLRRRDAHAWSEVWLAGRGWIRVDPSNWIGTAAPAEEGRGERTRAPRPAAATDPFRWLQRQWWGLDLAWTRLWLGFDRDAQAALLRRLLGDAQGALGLLLVAVLAAGLAAAVAVLRWLEGRAAATDPLRRELERWLRFWRRHGVEPLHGETLSGFGRRLARHWPELGAEVEAYVALHERLRHGPGPAKGGLGQLRILRRRLGRRRGQAAG